MPNLRLNHPQSPSVASQDQGTRRMFFRPGSQATFTLIVISGMCLIEFNLIGRYVLMHLAGYA